MTSQPYQNTFKQDGQLCFVADLPAWGHFGRDFDALEDEWTHYQGPPEEIEPWKKLAQRLGELVREAQAGGSRHWEAIAAELKQEFPEQMSQLEPRANGAVQELFESGQMPLAEYLEWLQHQAETKWASYAGASNGPDMDAFMARADRLGRRMQTAGYETEGDRHMKAEDPERYEFLQQSAALALDAMRDPNLEALPQMFEKQMELYRQSPLFAEGKKQMEQMRQQIEALKDSDPDLYQHQLASIEQMERFMEDPSASTANFPMALGEFDDGDDELAGDAGDSATLPAGHFRFTCGKRKQVSPQQVALFNQLVANQESLRPQIETALRELHRRMAEGDPMRDPSERVLFPENSDQSDVPLQCFRITGISLDGEDGRAVLSFDTPFGHFEEHGCSLAIQDGKVDRYGTWDEVFGD